MINLPNKEFQKMDDKINALEQKKKVLEHKISNKARKERTRRLIQKGALLEKYIGENMSLKDTENLLKVLEAFIKKNKAYVERQIKNSSD